MGWILIILVNFIGRGWFLSSDRRLARWRGFFFFGDLFIQKFALSFLLFRLLLLELLILLNGFNFAQNTVVRIVLSFHFFRMTALPGFPSPGATNLLR